ncbi:DUF3800 domain-containing protein [Hyphobacterium marinum]|uniref:DUF3800 domain-containing protein n=1 Tax=Hyphobacterium marinum TaxID=3116574 RepID=A0ABU7LVM5_9PROT|nr:DUF3800 domain-containing protein [Hyphobacterium sp. Y6023]MEE2565602.1 DUF3800 domain-containing protein [Hyphobacterium sp. Y6023]
MPNKYVFADESGCLAFKREGNASKYFICATATMDSCDIAKALLDLRRGLAWDGAELGDFFHASTDRQLVRDAVFSELLRHDFTIQATIMEKSKAQPQVRASDARFYQYGWLYHFRHGVTPQLTHASEPLITTASIGTKKQRAAFESAVNDVLRQTVKCARWDTDFCPAHADPCLQVADYAAWAIQRKYERDDTRSYDLIRDRITYEYDLWHRGSVHYY